MRLPLTMPLLLLSCAALLSGCGAATEAPDPRVVVKTEVRLVTVPQSLRSCAEKPAKPGPKATQRDAASFIVKFDGAFADCKAKLKAVDKTLSAQESAVNEFNAGQPNR